jgi:hypothetical protein
MSINWLILAPADEEFQIPTYGRYGGPDYAGGRLLRPGDIPSFTVKPTDRLDALFRKHDMDVLKAESPLAQANADLALIKGILKLPDNAVSGEGDLYAGAAILAMIGRITVTDRHPEVLARINLPKTIEKAVSLIEQGSIHPNAQEVAGLRSWLQHTSTVLASRGETALDRAADSLLDLAASLHGGNSRNLHFTLGGDAFTFPVGEAKSLFVHAAEAVAETVHSSHSGVAVAANHDATPALVLHQLDDLAHKSGLSFDHGDFLL